MGRTRLAKAVILKLREKKESSQKSKIFKNKFQLFFISIAFIFILGLLCFFVIFPNTNFTGFFIGENQQKFSQTINLISNDSTIHEWKLENLGQLKSVRINGLIEGDGDVKIYLDNILILDSSKIKSKSSTIILTGSTIEDFDTNESYSETEAPLQEESSPSQEEPLTENQSSQTDTTDAVDTNESEITTTNESYSETEAPLQEESSPSQEEPLTENQSSQTDTTDAVDTNESEITTTNESYSETEAPLQEESSPSQEEPLTENNESKMISFEDVCEETCDLEKLNLTNSSYTLRIEISNANLQLNNITYEIIQLEEIIGELINTTQYEAILGQPVKWKKEINNPEKIRLSIELPKDAENIIVNKITYTNESYSETEAPLQEESSPSQEEPLTEENKTKENQRFKEEKIKEEANVRIERISEKKKQQVNEIVEVSIQDNAEFYEIEYETPAPLATEEELSNGKRVKITSPEDIHYQNVLAFTEIDEELGITDASQIKIYWVEENTSLPFEKIEDKNSNGIYDYIEWIVPHLSNQTFEITIQPGSEGKDAYIDGSIANRNYGALDSVIISNTERALFEFDLSGVTSTANIVNANLTLYLSARGTGTNPITIQRINNSWTEGTGTGQITNNGVTWNNRSGSEIWNLAGGDFSPVIWATTNVSTEGIFYTWDITSLVQNWVNGTYPNYGILIKGENGHGQWHFSTSDNSNATIRPKLNITYNESTVPVINSVSIPSNIREGEEISLTANITDNLEVSNASIEINGENYSLGQNPQTISQTIEINPTTKGTIETNRVLNYPNAYDNNNDTYTGVKDDLLLSIKTPGVSATGTINSVKIKLVHSKVVYDTTGYVHWANSLGEETQGLTHEFNSTSETPEIIEFDITSERTWTFSDFNLLTELHINNSDNILKVYEAWFEINYTTPVSNDLWNGTVNTSLFSPGNYTYIIFANDSSQNVGTSEGNLEILPSLVLMNISLNDAQGNFQESEVLIYGENNEIEMNSSMIESQLISIEEGEKDIIITPIDSSVNQINYSNIIIENYTDGIIDIDEPLETENFTRMYALNPHLTTNATVSVTATGNELYKCKDWNFTEQTCYGEWIRVMSIVPGQEYNFTLSPEDPGFAEIIVITKAEHLDSNKSFISHIYNEVKELDGTWSEIINDEDYVRVTFEIPLDNTKDITLYPKIISGNPIIEVYEFNQSILIAEFNLIINDSYNTIYLSNLTGEQDTFDLRIVGGSIEFDHIIDPTTVCAGGICDVWFNVTGVDWWTVPEGVTNISVLVVAGGGGGGRGGTNTARNAGAGGAGGLIYIPSFGVIPGDNMIITVGAGGAGTSTSNYNQGGNGTNSTFGNSTGNLTAVGGGGGGSRDIRLGVNGGSGGGGALYDTTYYAGGISTQPTTNWGYTNTGFGNSGATTSASVNAGGGGGAGGASTSNAGGVGMSVFGEIYATGGTAHNTTSIAANTGNGGGTQATSSSGAGISGGSGIVRVRYIQPPDTTPPTYSQISTNSTTVGQITKFSINVSDNSALHPNGQYIFSTNNTGSWVNDTAVNFTTTPSWANVTKILNSTVGTTVGYRGYFNDSANNTNSTPIYTLNTTEFTLDIILPTITFESPTPDNSSTVYSSTQTIAANISDDNLEGNTSSWIDFDRSLVGYWSMDYYNATGIFDNSSYNNFGTFNGGLNYSNLTTGSRGQGLRFDGVDDVIDVNDISNMGQQFTISLWINTAGNGTYDSDNAGIFSKVSGWGTEEGFAITEKFSGDAAPTGRVVEIRIGNWTGGSNENAFIIDSGYPLNTWRYYTINWNYPHLSFYLNGSLIGNETWTYTINPTWQNVLLGQFLWGGFFNGSVDEVMLFNRSLSQHEISTLYTSQLNKFNATFTDLSLGQHNYTVYAIDEAGNINNSGERNFVVTNGLVCGTFNTHNQIYTLTQNVSSTETCFNITAQNITIDCNNYAIIGDNNINNKGIFINNSNTLIKNCRLINWSTDVYVENVNNLTLFNITGGSEYGLIVNGTSNSNFTDISFSNISNRGIWVTNNSHNNAFTNININTTEAGHGIYIDSGENNVIDCTNDLINGTNTSNTYGIYTDQLNTTIKNCKVSNFNHAIYLQEGSTNSIVRDSILNTTYTDGAAVYAGGGSSNFINVTGEATTGNNPLISGAFMVVSSDNNFTNCTMISSSSNGLHTALNIRSYGFNLITGSTIIATVGGKAVYLYPGSVNNTLRNNNITSLDIAIMLESNIVNNTIANNIINASGESAIDIYGSDMGVNKNIIANNTIISEGYGILFELTAEENIISNNTFISPLSTIIYVESTDAIENVFYWNNFTNTSGLYIEDSDGSNFYNTTINGNPEGNIYYNVLNGSVNIAGSLASDYGGGLYIGDSGTGYPYNSTNSYSKVTSNVVDYGPLTLTESGLQCGTLDTANTVYTLTQNVSSTGTCFTIIQSNITLDCNGYWINYSIGGEANTYGVYSYNTNNLTVKNCNIIDGNWSSVTEYSRVGIEFNDVTNGTIFNNTIRVNNSYALYLYNDANYNNLTANTVFSNTSLAIILDGNSVYNTLINNSAFSNGDAAIFLYQYSDNNTLIANNATSRFAGCFIYFAGYNNFSNNTCRNIIGIDSGLFLYDAYNNLFFNNTVISEIGTATNLGHSLNNTFIQHTSIVSGSGYYSFSLDVGTNNTIVRDCVNISGPDYAITSNGNSINNTFINCSYHSESIDDSSSELIRKWYYQAYANYSTGIAAENVNITAYNSTGQIQFTVNTSQGSSSGELMINGGFEWNNLTGWTTSGAGWDPGANPSAGTSGPQAGSYCAYNNVDSNSGDSIYQDVNISYYSEYIDSGNLFLNFEGWGVSSEATYDNTSIKVYFLFENETEISMPLDTIGNISSNDDWWRVNLTNYAIPNQTRYVRVWGNTYETGYASGSLDSFSLNVNYLQELSQGYIPRQEITEYINTGGTISYYNNYTINAILSGYETESNIFNFTETQNKLDDFFTFEGEFVDITSPTISFEEPPTPENSSAVYSSTQTIVANISDDNLEGNTSSWIDFDRSLVGYLSMDYYNETGIFDNSTYSNFGTFGGGLNYTNISTGSRGSALEFDGEDDYLILSSLNLTPISFTVGWWIYPFNCADYNQDFGVDWGQFQFHTNANCEVYVGTDADSRFTPIDLPMNTLSINEWQHFVYTYNGTSGSFYKNGEILAGPKLQNSSSFWDGQFHILNLNGSIDELIIFNRSLSETEILALYNSQSNLFNVTLIDLQDGQHNYTVYAIDEAGNYNTSGERNFIIEPDTNAPNVILNFPTGTIADVTPLINVSSSETGTIWYNLDNGENITLCNNCNSSQNKFLYAEEGSYTIYLFANDSSGNLNDTVSSSFTIDMNNNYYDNFNDNSSIQISNSLNWNTGNISFTGGYDYLDDPNLVSVYLFENSGNLGLDATGNNNMTDVGDPAQNTTTPDGFTGYSIELDGDDQVCNYSGFTFNASENHTMCFWVMKTAFSNDGNVFAQNCIYDTWDSTSEYLFTANNCFNQESIGIEGVYFLNEWAHICQVYDSTINNMTFYIDGSENTSHVFAGNPIQYHADQAWCIGGCNGGCWMTGNVFQPMWFDRTLNSDEILGIYSGEGIGEGNFTSYAINTSENIISITNITWTEINTDSNNHITVQVSADNGVTWHNATSGSALGETFTGENNSIIYRVFFATNSSTTIAISDMNITWSNDEEQIPGPEGWIVGVWPFDLTTSGNNFPYGITQNGTFFWIGDWEDNVVYKYYFNGTYTGESFSIVQSGNYGGITQNGTFFWITDWYDMMIYKYYINGTYTQQSSNTTVGGGTTDPSGITQDGTFLWITNWVGGGKIYKYWMNNLSYESSFNISSQMDDPVGIDRNGNFLWIGSDSSGTIYKYYLNGTSTEETFSHIYGAPGGITNNGTFFWIPTGLQGGGGLVYYYKGPDTYIPSDGNYTWTGELTINGGFEWGNLTGWQVLGDGWEAGTNPADGTAGTQAGSYCAYYDLKTGTNKSNYIYQDVNLTNYAGYIDSGNAVINISGWGVSAEYNSVDPENDPWDQALINFSFLNSTNGLILTTRDTGYRHFANWWNVGMFEYPIPAGTRYIRVYGNTYQNLWESGSLDSFSVMLGYNSSSFQDTIPPTISFESPTPNNGSTVTSPNQTIVANISDASNTSSWIDFDRSLLGYWSMDYYNATGIYDNSTYSNFGTFIGLSNYSNVTNGARGKGFMFDGESGQINFTNGSSVLNTATFTTSLWINPKEEIDDSFLLVNTNLVAPWCGWGIRKDGGGTASCDNGEICLWLSDCSTGYEYIDYVYDFPEDSWTHLVISFDNLTKSVIFYINGNLVNSETSTYGITFSPLNTFFSISSFGEYPGLNGSLDEIMLFNRTLSQTEILALYNSQSNLFNATFTDLSEGQHNYTVYTIDEAGNYNSSGERNFNYSTENLDCGTLDSANTVYTLTQNVSSQGTCFTITQPNITLDCNNYWINYSTGGIAGYGVYTDQFNSTVKNCNIILGDWSSGASDDNNGIYLNEADNTTIFNNYVKTNNSAAIFLEGEANFNNVTNNTAYSGLHGIDIQGHNNYISDNFANSSGVYYSFSSAITIYGGQNNTLINNTLDARYASLGLGNFANNTLSINNTILSTEGEGIYLQDSFNNTFINENVSTYGSYGVRLEISADNTFKDSTISSELYDVEVGWDEGDLNNVFVNCSYDTERVNGVYNELIRKWYYQAYANYSNGTEVAGANISAYNATGQLQFTELTNSSGLINRQEITEYINTGGTRSYYNNYSINASFSGYTTDNNVFNFTTTQNKVDDVFTLSETQVPGENACGTLSTIGNTYTLTRNVSSQGTCFLIDRPNITLDCNGYWINYSINGVADTYGVYTNQFNTTIKNCNIVDGNWETVSETREGIYLDIAENCTLFNNTVTTNTSLAIFVNSNWNNITRNKAMSGFGGISIAGTHNILIENLGNCTAVVAWYGAGISVSNIYNTLINNTAGSTSYALSLSGEANYTTLINNTAISSESTAFLINGADNIIVVNQIAHGYFYGIGIEGDSSNNLFRDCINISGSDVEDIGLGSDPGAINNTFLNCSYTTESVTGVGNELIRKWYYQAYTNYSNGTEVAGANITAYNTTGDLQFTTSTNSTGYISRQEVIEYINTGGTKSYYNNYTINATLLGYDTESNVFNFTTQQNKIDDVFTLSENLIPGENACGTLDTANTVYTLTQNVSSQGTCFTITQPNITLDCNNYWINYSTGGAADTYGVYTNQFNTTVKNCNVVDGNWTSNEVNRNGFYLIDLSNSTIFNNFVSTNNSVSIVLYGSDAIFNNITSNRIFSNSSEGIYANYGPTNDLIMNNTVITGGAAVHIECDNFIIISNNLTSTGESDALTINGADNSTVINNILNAQSWRAMWLSGSNSNITGNIITANSIGILLPSDANNNYLVNNTIVSLSNVAIAIFSSSNNNTLIYNNVTGLVGYSFEDSNYTTVSDCVYISGSLYDLEVQGTSTDSIFINCSYDTSKESVTAGNELIRKWYYQAYTNYSNGTLVAGANISAYNTTGQLQFTTFTNSSGFIQRQEITEYVNTGGTRSYYNNYSINASFSGYTTDNNVFNFTTQQNKIDDVFTLSENLIPGENACGTLDTANTVYTLTQNVSSQGTCFTITQPNITLDCNNYWINYSTGGAADTYGVYTNQFNTTIKNCNIVDGNWSSTSEIRFGIYLNGADNNTILNNSVTTNVSSAITLSWGASFNNLTENIGTSGRHGIDIMEDNNNSNNILINNLGNSTTDAVWYGSGIYVSNENNLFINNTGESKGYGIYIASSNNAVFINNTAISREGIALFLVGPVNNTFINQIAEVRGEGSSGIQFAAALNNTFRDCINISGPEDVSITSSLGSTNNTFINCSYDTEVIASSDGEIIRKWYYQAYTNYSNGTVVAGGNVSAYNTTGQLQFTASTNSSGLIERQEVTEYVNTGGTRAYYNNYTINSSLTGYTTDNNVFNFTTQQNKVDDVFTLIGGFTNSQVESVALAPLSEDTFALAWCDEAYNHVRLQIYNTNGTNITEIIEVDEDNNYCDYYSVSLSALSSNTFVVGWIDATDTDATFSIYWTNGTLMTGPVDADDSVVSPAPLAYSASVSALSSNTFVFGWSDADDDDVSFSVYYTNGTLITGPVDVDETTSLTSTTSVSALSSTTFVIGWHDDEDSDATFAVYWTNGTLITGPIDADDSIESSSWAQQPVSVASITSEIFVMGWADRTNNDALFSVYWTNGTLMTGPIQVDGTITNYGHDNTVSLSRLSSSTFVMSWFDDDDDDDTFSIYWINGTIKHGPIDSETNTETGIYWQAVSSSELVNNIGFCNQNFVHSFVINSTSASWIPYLSNGTIWNGTCISSDSPPQIYSVTQPSPVTLTDGPSPTFLTVNFSVYDANGASNLNSSTASINFTKSGEASRQNNSCVMYESSGNYANYTCNVTMWWFDAAGNDWKIYANISDLDSNIAVNDTIDFTVNSLTGFVVDYSSLNFATLVAGSHNQTPVNHFTLNNTGNVDITLGNIEVNATDLVGEKTYNQFLFAGNFSASPYTGDKIECNITGSATQMNNYTFTKVSNTLLTAGNYTLNNGIGQEELYFCLREVGIELTQQQYSTDVFGSWTIRIVLVALSIRRKKKKNSKESENITIPVIIFSKNLGALEALSKYMKENLGLSYHNIGELLNRNEKTIWTAYNKAIGKQKEIIEVKGTEIFIPISKLNNRELTILESVIIYLRKKDLKYSEIGKLINRDQRNVRSIYYETENRVKEEEFVEFNPTIPLTIFSSELGALEATSKYMKENLGLSYHNIGKLLNRDERTIWTAYNKAIGKQKEIIEVNEKDLSLPLSIFNNRELTILESVIIYLRKKEMKYSEIGKLINRDQRNVRGIYKKIENNI